MRARGAARGAPASAALQRRRRCVRLNPRPGLHTRRDAGELAGSVTTLLATLRDALARGSACTAEHLGLYAAAAEGVSGETRDAVRGASAFVAAATQLASELPALEHLAEQTCVHAAASKLHARRASSRAQRMLTFRCAAGNTCARSWRRLRRLPPRCCRRRPRRRAPVLQRFSPEAAADVQGRGTSPVLPASRAWAGDENARTALYC